MPFGLRRLKEMAWKLLCQVMFWSGAGPILAWVSRRRSHSRWTILTYHRVGCSEPDGGPDIVTRERFRTHLRYAKRRYDVVTVGEALKRLNANKWTDKPLLSITFDDGYRDNVSDALPILIAEGCPATLFVTVEAIRDGLPPWPHRLQCDLTALVANPERNDQSTGQRALHPLLETVLMHSGSPRDDVRSMVRRVVEAAKSLPASDSKILCYEAASLTGGAGCRAAAMMTVEDLVRWQQAGLEVGSHTTNHQILSRLSAQERRADLATSRRWLEDALNVKVDLLAYPNGRSNDWDERTIRDAGETGFRSGLTTIEGTNVSGADPFRLKRISVGDDSVPVFAIRVSGLFGTLRAWLHRKLATPADRGIEKWTISAGGNEGGRREALSIALIGGRGVGSSYSGIERYYEEVGSRLAERGHRVIAYCRSTFSPAVKSFRGIELRHLPTLRSKHLETFVHTGLATLDVCFRNVDIVQFHALGSSPFSWIPRLVGKRTIVSVRGLDWQRAKWGRIARAYLRACEWSSIYCPTRTIVVSRTLKAYFDSRFDRQCHFIPNGVSRMDAHPADAIREWGLEHRKYLLYAGRISPEKGLECLIKAYQSLDLEHRLVIAGGSSYSEKYIQRLHEVARGRVIFTGFVEGRLLAELYSNALAFVLPSQMEGLSVALLEALTYGLPAIVSDIPENRELVDDFGGFVFRVDDINSLADAIRRVVVDEDAALRVGMAAQEGVRSRLSWDVIAGETERFYRNLVVG